MAVLPTSIRGERITSIDRQLSLMKEQLESFERRCDHRAAFLRVYTIMTTGVKDHLHKGTFLDPAWIEQVAIHFCSYYFQALDDFEAGRGRNHRAQAKPVPPAWQLAHTRAVSRKAFALQDVLLGMNAHINNDLAQTVADLTADTLGNPALSIRRHFDHSQINRVLELMIPPSQTAVAKHYARLTRPLDRLLGSLDEALALYGLVQYRERVWNQAQFLLACQTEAERDLVRQTIEADALTVGKDIDLGRRLWPLRPLAAPLRRLRLL